MPYLDRRKPDAAASHEPNVRWERMRRLFLAHAGVRGFETWMAWQVLVTVGIFVIGLVAIVIAYLVRHH